MLRIISQLLYYYEFTVIEVIQVYKSWKFTDFSSEDLLWIKQLAKKKSFYSYSSLSISQEDYCELIWIIQIMLFQVYMTL